MGSREKNFYNALVAALRVRGGGQGGPGPLPRRARRTRRGARCRDELIDTVSLVGPKEKVRDKLQVFREAGVHTLGVTPLAFDKDGPARAAAAAGGAERRLSARILLGAFGDPGHAFPMIALGAELARRGHDVTLQTWAKWRDARRGRGHDVRRGARVPRVPHARRGR